MTRRREPMCSSDKKCAPTIFKKLGKDDTYRMKIYRNNVEYHEGCATVKILGWLDAEMRPLTSCPDGECHMQIQSLGSGGAYNLEIKKGKTGRYVEIAGTENRVTFTKTRACFQPDFKGSRGNF